MLNKKNRLSTAIIKDIFDSRTKNSSSDFFYVKKRPNDLGLYRFSIIIGKKIYKTAVKRHQTKRRIISIIKNTENIPNFDYILTLRTNISEISDEKIKKDLVKILK
ncbi:MAG TPA: ribonuclease P protein component [Candidatus Paceibacterota bacterium]|nr:ribonuclease P protein component [Candidatus Paceibacterota bacterium]